MSRSHSTSAAFDDRTGRNDCRVNLFGGRSYRGGRVRVYGCSPGCLLISLGLSLFLTIVLNLLIRAF